MRRARAGQIVVSALLLALNVACSAESTALPSTVVHGEPYEQRGPSPLELASQAPVVAPSTTTSFVCSLLGLGAIDTVPFNFPGATEAELQTYPGRENLIPERNLPAGAQPDVARVLAGDMGWPFEHTDGLVYFTFDDAFFAPASSMSSCSVSTPDCVPVALNDDFLARADPERWEPNGGCTALEIERAPGAAEFLPITINGPVSAGGLPTGNGAVLGPGFSSGKFMFLRVPLAAASCTTDADCVASSGLAGDSCLLLAPELSAYCYFGPCHDDGPCALRGPPSTLVVRSEGSNFVPPRVGEHIASDEVLSAYRGHFATVSFQARIDPTTNSGVLWTLGRDSYWSAPGLPMNPYLMSQPVNDGVLGEPAYLSGFRANGEPLFDSDPEAAIPLYSEIEALPHHSSLAYFPNLEGGTWLLIYGGHAQPGLRGHVNTFVRPESESLFYSRTAGIYLRWAKQPWGPWSAPTTIFDPYTSEAGYCQEMFFDDPDLRTGFKCPEGLVERNMRLNRLSFAGMAGEYGAAIIPRSLRRAPTGEQASFRWLLSTWNPYRVIEIETHLVLPLRY